MKNSRGISVLALVITVVVIIIITSITAYTGINMISDARKKDATDKLKVICNALRKEDDFLGFDDASDVRLTKEQYKMIDLENYYDEKYPVYLTKSITNEETQKVVTYSLKMYDGISSTDVYAEENFTIIESLEKKVYDISFDESKGVNRPLLFEGMYALTLDGKNIVQDVYEDNWYDYTSQIPSFAKMKIDSDSDGSIEDEEMTYVWIPRYAYYIQSYYDGNSNLKPFENVPTSALQIVFLKEDTYYMNNNEVMPGGYNVHPAFSNENGELSGIWIAMETSENSTNIESAIIDAKSIIDTTHASSHLMTNSEYAAALYLMHAKNSFEQIKFSAENEFVAATIEGSNSSLENEEYVDLYKIDNDSATGIENKYGDAMSETNWGRYSEKYPTNANPYIIRLLKSGLFDFTSVSDAEDDYHYRAVIVNK